MRRRRRPFQECAAQHAKRAALDRLIEEHAAEFARLVAQAEREIEREEHRSNVPRRRR